MARAPTKALYARVMHPNLASIMPQAVAVWCERAGHDVRLVCFTGAEDLIEELSTDIDLLFVGAFTQAAQLAYAVSNLFRQHGVVTVLGGPHARCYPEDACKYFDYVVGFTDEALVGEILADCSPHRPVGVALSAKLQPRFLPGVRERWKFIEPILNKAPTNVKVVPMLASLGCPYTCAFCIDSVVDYQPLDRRQITEDLRFLAKTMPSAWVAWHDPNFGVRFDEIMTAIEDAVEPGTLKFGAESSLSLLSEPNLRRLRKAGFKAMLPGIESWYSLGDKSKTGNTFGMAKVNHVSEHVNLIGRYIPYVQTNFVVGLDDDAGREPFELTKRFIDKTPATFPGLLAAVGVRPGGAAQLGHAARRSRLTVSVSLPQQQPGDERHAEELRLGGFLRQPHRPDEVLVLATQHQAARAGEQILLRRLDECHSRRLLGRLRAHQVLLDRATLARLRQAGAGLLRR